MNHLPRFLPLAATVVTIGVNAAADAIPLNGYSTGELSALYPTGFTPAGWVFGIWALIYLGLLAFSGWCLLAGPGTRRRAHALVPAFLVSCVANCGWIFAWHYRQVGLSFILMGVLLLSVAVIYVRLSRIPASGWQERLAVDATFSLYFGWLTTATIANLGVLLFDLGHYPFGLAMDEWALVSVVLAVAIYGAMEALTRDLLYGAVFVWAAMGIALQGGSISDPVKLAAATGAAAVAGLIVISVLRLIVRRRGPAAF